MIQPQPAAPFTSDPQALSGNAGLIPAANVRAVEEAERATAEQQNNQQVIQGLAGHVRKCFEAAKTAKQGVEQRMLSNLRARRGEYDSETLAKIRRTGGSEVFMMLSSAKARSATAWLRDTLMGNGNEKPWTISPTKEPEIPEAAMQNAVMKAGELVQQLQDMLGGPQMVPESQVEDLLELARGREKVEVTNIAKSGMAKMESLMEDQLQEGGFARALFEFTDDISTFPAAIIKGPVVRKRPKLEWVTAADGTVDSKISEELLLEWERVSPFNAYPAPDSYGMQDGYFIELHKMRPHDLEALIGVEGYSTESIKQVITEHGSGGLKQWTGIESDRADAEGKDTSSTSDTTSVTIDALQYWGTVLGKDLIDFGLDAKKVPDSTKTYNCEVWVIGQWVIKATLNYDPFGRKPYYKASWEEIPGAFWGNSPIDLIADCQTVCNNAARALTNNMAVASGPQVDVNTDRVPPGEDITSQYPWKVWQTRSDPFGNTNPAISFFQPQSNAAELMGIYTKFSDIADEVSGIPKYLTGDAAAGGAGRTASGLAMMLGNAGKSIKSVVASIDSAVIGPLVERLYYHNMRYGTNPALKNTDCKVIARGATSMIVREQAQVRRNEFLNIVLSSPVVAGIIGGEAVATLLRTMAAGLEMDTDKIVPPPEVIKARLFQQQQQALQQRQAAQQAALMGQDVPLEEMQFQHDESGKMTGAKIMPGQKNRQLPVGGGQTTNNFTPQRGA